MTECDVFYKEEQFHRSDYIQIAEHDPGIARMAARYKLPAGDSYICGKDFLVKVICWADSYKHNSVSILLVEMGKVFHEERLRVCRDEHWRSVLYQPQTFDEFLNSLFKDWIEAIKEKVKLGFQEISPEIERNMK